MSALVHHNSILGYTSRRVASYRIGRRLRAVASHWRGFIMAGVCIVGAILAGALTGLLMWGLVASMTLADMAQTIPLTNVR
jgi:hypothetical protein